MALQVEAMKSLVPAERIEKCIYLIRGQKVMLDEHLAQLYNVETKALNRAVKRNIERFPAHFMFQLTRQEFDEFKNEIYSSNLKFQFGISSSDWGGRRKRPYAFTEQGVAMLSSVLRSKRAIQVNIVIMDIFVKLRQMLISHEDLARKIHQLEAKYDSQFKVVFDAMRELMAPTVKSRRKIGFKT